MVASTRMGLFSFFKLEVPDMPDLMFFNTLSGKVEEFTPLSNREVKMYNCGPTVYDEQTIGNLRGPILANTLKRVLNLWGYKVNHLSNITDVGHLLSDADDGEDKMEASAKKSGKSAQAIAEEITEKFFTDLDLLGVDRTKMRFSKATEYVPEQIALVKTLWEKGYAYQTTDGIYFDTAKFKTYGALGNIDLGGQKEGARVEENQEKKNRHDFALWKFSKKDEQRQQEWQSPWGIGFPGWHIECTAMIFKLLGKQIDIHMGGIDLIPIHHNNEIAQAEAATGKKFVECWMHNAFITIEGKKISKSLGNTIYLHQIIEKGYSPRSLRYWYLTGHYRAPMNFTWEAIAGADQARMRLTRHYLELKVQPASLKEAVVFTKEFYAAIANDLDTPKALAWLWECIKDNTITPEVKKKAIEIADKVFGLGITEARAAAKLTVIEQNDLPQEVQTLVQEREVARTEKDFAKADELRKEIEAKGFEVKDTGEGAQLVKK